MKRTSILLQLFSILSFSLISVLSFAQKTIDASTIVEAIKSDQDVSYKNVTITGVLDMTSMEEELPDLPKLNRWNQSDNTIKAKRKGNISFVNCTFEDDVYAYFHDDDFELTRGDSYYTFIANFDGEVIFKDCTFNERAWFKYSEFDDNTDFSGSTFEESSTFKYAEFDKNASFENTVFEDENSFKYAKFDNYTSFANSTFEKNAIFKYTEFQSGASFENSLFKKDLNFKYVKIDDEYIDQNMEVRGDMNTKYASIDGRHFSKKKKRKNK